MSQSEHEVEIATGRRDGDGHVRVSVFAVDLLAVAVEGHGERAPTLLLTLEQARKLQAGLAKLISVVEAGGDTRESGNSQGREERAAEEEDDDANAPPQQAEEEKWPGLERRVSGELR